MQPAPFALLSDLAADPAHGWSIGSFGAIGEFVRDADEPARVVRGVDRIEIATARGAIRIAPAMSLAGFAWDSLSADGESWGHALALLVPRPPSGQRTIRALGPDLDAIDTADRSAQLFDIGVGAGAVRMCVRTRDAGLIAALEAAEDHDLLACPAVMTEVLCAQPHRVMLSPAGRIEVYQPIPAADSTSPIGPHTHLLPSLVPRDRTHSSNVPIPEGWQAALTVHPRSPWRTPAGERIRHDAAADAAFAPLLAHFQSAGDATVARTLHAAIDGAAPEFADWPVTRRGRTKARIVLRRLAAIGDERVMPWRARHDHLSIETEEGEDA